MGAQLVDVPATRFAVRSLMSRKLAWEEVPLGMVVRGLVDSNSGRPLLKVVTRLSTAAEMAFMQHVREAFDPLLIANPGKMFVPAAGR